MLWICLTAWAGLFIWYFRMRKKAEDHKLVRRIFCLAATGFIAGTALCLPIGVRKVSGDEKAELQLERGALGSQPTEEIRNRKELHCLYLQELTAQKR